MIHTGSIHSVGAYLINPVYIEVRMFMQRIFIGSLLILSCFFTYAHYQSGYCGYGYFNKWPLGLEGSYSNGFWVTNKDDGIILLENRYVSESNLQNQNVKYIEKFAYTQNEFYAQVLTQDGLNLYALVRTNDPTVESVEFVKASNFSSINNVELKWIGTRSSACNFGFYNDLMRVFYPLLLLLIGLVLTIIWFSQKKRQ